MEVPGIKRPSLLPMFSFRSREGLGLLPAPRVDLDERNYRIRLLPRVFVVKAQIRVIMQDPRARNQSSHLRTEDFSGQAMLLTPAAQRSQPVPHHLRPRRRVGFQAGVSQDSDLGGGRESSRSICAQREQPEVFWLIRLKRIVIYECPQS